MPREGSSPTQETASGLLPRDHRRSHARSGFTTSEPMVRRGNRCCHMAVLHSCVKLRQAQLGRQKGVDSRIVRPDRARPGPTSAYVLSGDEDIREGVAEAQDCGVSVVLLGITPRPGQNNQARSLVQEADGLVMLTRDVVGQWFTPCQTVLEPAHRSARQTFRRSAGNGEAWAQLNPQDHKEQA